MSMWWGKYLEDISKDEIAPLLARAGFTSPLIVQKRILEQAALCRLAFASLVDIEEKPLAFSVPNEAIISRTQLGMTKGRPQTARWGFWTGYLLKQECINEKDLSSSFLAELIGILLGHEVDSKKVRTVFPELRKEAEDHATGAAQIFIKGNLKPDMSEKQFKRDMTSNLVEDLLPDTSMPPMIEDGKLKENWVQGILNARKAILRRIHKHGLLAGQSPIIRTASLTRIAINVPLNPYNQPPIGSSSREGGSIHFEKSKEVAIPPPVLEKEKIKSLNFIGNEDGGGTTSISFPQYILNTEEPFVAALFALPVWWYDWQTAFRAK